eukprot:jgi/Mesen1/10979/ME000096S10557
MQRYPLRLSFMEELGLDAEELEQQLSWNKEGHGERQLADAYSLNTRGAPFDDLPPPSPWADLSCDASSPCLSSSPSSLQLGKPFKALTLNSESPHTPTIMPPRNST